MQPESYLDVRLVHNNKIIYEGRWPLSKALLPLMKKTLGTPFWKLMEEQTEVKRKL